MYYNKYNSVFEYAESMALFQTYYDRVIKIADKTSLKGFIKLMISKIFIRQQPLLQLVRLAHVTYLLLQKYWHSQ